MCFMYCTFIHITVCNHSEQIYVTQRYSKSCYGGLMVFSDLYRTETHTNVLDEAYTVTRIKEHCWLYVANVEEGQRDALHLSEQDWTLEIYITGWRTLSDSYWHDQQSHAYTHTLLYLPPASQQNKNQGKVRNSIWITWSFELSSATQQVSQLYRVCCF